MDIRIPQLKRQLRTSLTYAQTLLKGYPFRYAREQCTSPSETYNVLWGEFVTKIPHKPGADTINANRLWNLNQAARQIDGLVLQPGEVFGFWNRVPKPTLRNGFRAGPAFKRGKVTTDVGGGLCLISTNLFNAFLLAGCEILERHHHSMDPYGDRRFFPLGRDAMVYHGYRDLIVCNQRDVPIQLRLSVLAEEGIVRCSVMAPVACPVLVKLEAEILDHVPVEQPGQIEGYRVVAQRWVMDSNTQAKSKMGWVNDYSVVSSYEPCAAYFGAKQPAMAVEASA